MKKGVVLFFTLSFITVLSLLLLDNLNKTDKFISTLSLEKSLTQLLFTRSDIKRQIQVLFKNYKEESALSQIIEFTSNGVPFKIKDIDIHVSIDYFENENGCNLNQITSTEDIYKLCESDITDRISYIYDFSLVLQQFQKTYGEFTNRDQVEYFLEQYILKTGDSDILEVKQKFGYYQLDDKKEYLICKYMIYDNYTLEGSFIFVPGGSKILYEIIYFFKS